MTAEGTPLTVRARAFLDGDPICCPSADAEVILLLDAQGFTIQSVTTIDGP